MVKTAFIIFFLIGIAVSSYGQNKQPLRILRTTKDTLDIRYNDYLDSLSWILSPRKKIDILPIEIDNTPVRVTFISDADSLSFNVKLGEKYDFIIANGSKNYPTRIEGIQAYQTSKDDSLANVNLQCLKTDLLSVVERNKQYPFSKAKRIELISFADTASDFTIPLPVKNGQLDQAKIQDQRVLNAGQINGLTDILFNIGRTPVPNLKYSLSVGATCYDPRNGILFIDSNDRVFEYIEICFGCQKNRYSSRRIKPWDDCDQKYDILRQFFADQGVKFGTTER